MEACYGLGNEAVEIGLTHANKENALQPISQVIVIGDAPPNTEEEVQNRRKSKGEAYWQGAGDLFEKPVYTDKELEKLAQQNISVHAFYVADEAKTAFGKIAAATTEGVCEELNVTAKDGAEKLTALVSQAALKGAGSSQLVEAYTRRYGGKSYF